MVDYNYSYSYGISECLHVFLLSQCDKIKKKRGTFIGAFSLANSSTLEEAGLKITRAV